METTKNYEGKALVIKEHSLSKEKKEELNEKQDTNTEIQVNIKNKDTIDTVNRIDEGGRDDSHQQMLSLQ